MASTLTEYSRFSHFAIFHFRQERFAEAESALQKLMTLAEKEIDISELEKADYIELYAETLEQLGRNDEAATLRERVREIWEVEERREDDSSDDAS